MREVLISIKPKWCELIASGKKTVEVRKTRPNCEVPFKCYIYETKALYKPNGCKCLYEGKGKVIGHFICDKVVKFPHDPYDPAFSETADLSCVGIDGLSEYLGHNDYGYGWHITDLIVYDEPRELSEFYHYCGDDPNCSGCEAHYFSNTECGKEDYCCSPIEGCKPIKRAPQSWQFCVATEPRQTAD